MPRKPRRPRKLIISDHDAALGIALRLLHERTAAERDRDERIERAMEQYAALGCAYVGQAQLH